MICTGPEIDGDEKETEKRSAGSVGKRRENEERKKKRLVWKFASGVLITKRIFKVRRLLLVSPRKKE